MKTFMGLLVLLGLMAMNSCSKPRYYAFATQAATTSQSKPVEAPVLPATPPASEVEEVVFTASTQPDAPVALAPIPEQLPERPKAKLLSVPATPLSPRQMQREIRKNLRQLDKVEKVQLRQHTQHAASRPKRMVGFAIVSLVFGLVGLFVIGIVAGVLAILFGAIALNKISNDPTRFKGRGMGVAGIVLGIVDAFGTFIIMSNRNH
ncbi:protein of unknown function [Catalinimonas alkaloidigena]|uniref:DUF4190 domain-containing protein n=1 Tax=Catalinimonas alkaloidigena TaxID=1075417 RepID=A0A1G9S547_9BACT|nr:DUF4190 domain-containing protein [Catalinimonas alkaloidigena]SDM30688.1 protein of unknown function [Catalinimonas alkaloidigena]